MRKILFVAAMLLSQSAMADLQMPVTITNSVDMGGSLLAAGQGRSAGLILYRSDRSGALLPGIVSETSMDFSAGGGGASFAVYGFARGYGGALPFYYPGMIHDIVGVHGTAKKDFNGWAAGVHADCYDSFPGGTCIGVNVEFPQTQIGTDTIGLNVQPSDKSRGIVGIQLQNPQAYKYGIDAANTSIVFGRVDAVPFGMRFNPVTQRLEFFRNIGNPDEIRIGFLDMSFAKPDVQINK